MTDAQILQAEIMYDFFCRLTNPYDCYSDRDLMKLYRTAQETQDGKNIGAIKAEMSRRSREI